MVALTSSNASRRQRKIPSTSSVSEGEPRNPMSVFGMEQGWAFESPDCAASGGGSVPGEEGGCEVLGCG